MSSTKFRNLWLFRKCVGLFKTTFWLFKIRSGLFIISFGLFVVIIGNFSYCNGNLIFMNFVFAWEWTKKYNDINKNKHKSIEKKLIQ